MNLMLPILGAALFAGLFLRNNRQRWILMAIVIVLTVTRYYLRGS